MIIFFIYKTRKAGYRRNMKHYLSIIKQLFPHLNPSEKKVADYILQNSNTVVDENIQDLAVLAKTSTAAITRFCKRIGCEGFMELRLALAREIFSTSPIEQNTLVKPEEARNIDDLTAALLDTIVSSLFSLKPLLSTDKIEKAVDIISNSRHILLIGIGASGLVASDFQQKLIRIGIPAFCPSDPDIQIVQACSLNTSDVAILFSYSGETNHTLRTAIQAHKAGAKVIAVTRIRPNSLSKISDIVLQVPDTEALFREGATLSRINQLVVVDILYAALISRKKDAAEHISNTWKAVSHIGAT